MIASAEQIAGIGFTSQRTRTRMVKRLKECGIRNEQLLEVMAAVPRHLFVDEAISTRAYDDVALPIGEGQTISQPFAVARMTEILLEDGPIERVLEVGTGSGYQAAVLSQLVEAVFTVERIRTLLDRARRRFRALQYRNIHTRYSDGGWGWSGHGPYDGIMVTAAPESIPEPLLEQLAIGGRMIVPVGEQGGTQSLTIITRTHQGFSRRQEHDVNFVPFLSGKS
ncbi:protein-L-isoaspartate(D-aspartate) O-methyltransferase [Granulosicoccus antarcticus]|uniref:Protein-L-isoaspartate O-methyltransferase n=1 Tax=Granulosicoccus antarcticus IMCC3135 TaxID=1192854 RepID=A0A2Z2P5P2_9GAMM|nr:protein-L-isoaspartate(D-aspartate) O-methyltransferase [Granulosicoccus antarcticus]ASJ75144.1 Protein-L-isoaspartate O-methyltransferase [Granulosicoccus antarcticus IMCC3135]